MISTCSPDAVSGIPQKRFDDECGFVSIRDVNLHFRKTSSPFQRLKSFYNQVRRRSTSDVINTYNQSVANYKINQQAVKGDLPDVRKKILLTKR